MCHQEKPESDFAFRSIARGVRQGHCRACHAAYRRRHYLANREAYVAREAARIKAYRIDNRQQLYDYLIAHPCVECGETDVLVLEFDHRDPKSKLADIGFIVARKPWKLVLAEIAKCDVRCVNCHRRRTARQFNWAKARSSVLTAGSVLSPVATTSQVTVPIADSGERRCRVCGELRPIQFFAVKNKRTARRVAICRRCQAAYGREHYRKNKPDYLARGKKNKKRYRRQNRERLIEYLQGKSCVDCGESDPVLMEFDHRDGADKTDEVGRLIGTGQWAKVEAEIAKCEIRCGNCHRRRTAEQFGWAKRSLQIAATRKAATGA
jgi:hypothetical protein